MTLEHWVAEVGPGWKHLVEPVLRVALNNDIPIHQVKEKWGGLVIALGPVPDEGLREDLRKIIEYVEKESLRTCERCGAPGKVRGYGWAKTLCGTHAVEHRLTQG